MAHQKFDLVLLNIFLPDGNGTDWIPKIKAQDPDIGIITLTTYNSRDIELRIRQQGIFNFLTKPVDLETLRAIIEHISSRK